MSGNRLKILAGLLVAVLVLLVGILIWWVTAGGEQTGPEALPASSPTAGSPVARPSLDSYREEREEMVDYQIKGRGVSDAEVLQAMNSVPRHEFVPADYLDLAYSDGPLPIGHGQTISQPYIVALMTELLDLEPGDRVLEIGTGSGYQAAVLAELGVEVYSVEIIPELAESARQLLDRMGYGQVQTLNADGYYGWEEHAPYDAIIVTAAPDHVPQPLVRQLKDGGRMVIPVGPVGWYQTLWLITKEHGEVEYHNQGGVQFVPLTGEH
ncbi:MAG: protein-L-isoaspartate(D-aspartate) O-methyltransferase [Anaerolineae bacterium]|nr:protein-L-isoaspartate(D-aspartate) O-methyltransferase [Anaerolineae bacterium]